MVRVRVRVRVRARARVRVRVTLLPRRLSSSSRSLPEPSAEDDEPLQLDVTSATKTAAWLAHEAVVDLASPGVSDLAAV